MISRRLIVAFVIPDLRPGGATGSMLRACRLLIEAGHEVKVTVLGDRAASLWAKYEEAGAGSAVAADLASTDLVIIWFWNAPAMMRFIAAEHPPMRVVLRPCVEGNIPPHVITDEVAAFADVVWLQCSSTLGNRHVAGKPHRYVQISRDFSRFTRPPAVPMRTDGALTAGYLGFVDFAKLHPDYVRMNAAAGRDLLFELWGPGGAGLHIEREAREIGRSDQFHIMGVTTDPVETLRRFDIFAYPLSPESYSANDAVLQEAMAAGLPSVVLDHPGNRDLVEDGETALVARSAAEYVEGLALLRKRPDLRASIGSRAGTSIRERHQRWSRDNMLDAVDDVITMPKRQRSAQAMPAGAELFVSALGEPGGAFARSLAALKANTGPAMESAEAEIASASPGMRNPGGGGLFAYRAEYPDDPVLRYWTGLAFEGSGRLAVALAEFGQAQRLGMRQPMIADHIARLAATLANRDSRLPGFVMSPIGAPGAA
jgi:hypothetical protein